MFQHNCLHKKRVKKVCFINHKTYKNRINCLFARECKSVCRVKTIWPGCVGERKKRDKFPFSLYLTTNFSWHSLSPNGLFWLNFLAFEMKLRKIFWRPSFWVTRKNEKTRCHNLFTLEREIAKNHDRASVNFSPRAVILRYSLYTH